MSPAAVVALKWACALVGAGLVPLGGHALRRWPRLIPPAVVLLGLLPFLGLNHLSLNLISFENYRGDSRGLEITAVDFLACALWLALPPASRPTPYKRARFLYLALALVSIPLAAVPLYAAFGVWKVARMFFVMTVAFRACEDPKLVPLLLRGMALGVVYEGLLAGWQHFVQHVYRASGNLGHENSLTMACNLIAPIALAVLLARRQRVLAACALLAAMACAIFGLSRGSLTMLVFELALVAAVSLLRGPTRHKLTVALVGLVCALGIAAKALPSIIDRFQHAPAASGDSRVRFARAAWLMTLEHPLGVGLNQFSYVFEHGGYAQRAGIAETDYDASAIVHNVYLLNAAELGLFGLFAYLLLIAGPLRLAISGTLRAGSSIEGDILLGCTAALLAAYAQGMLEWLSRQTPFAYLFFLIAGLIGGLHSRITSAGVARPAPARRAAALAEASAGA